MNISRMSTITSLLLIVLATIHLAQDIAYGYEPGTVNNLFIVPFTVVWLYGALVLAGKRSGYIITLLLSLFSFVVPYIHMSGKGAGVASRVAYHSGHLFFVWTLLAIGVLGVFNAILCLHGLWSLPWRRRG